MDRLHTRVTCAFTYEAAGVSPRGPLESRGLVIEFDLRDLGGNT